MNVFDLFDSIGNADDEFIVNAAKQKKSHKRLFSSVASIAACLVIACVGLFVLKANQSDLVPTKTPEITSSSYSQKSGVFENTTGATTAATAESTSEKTAAAAATVPPVTEAAESSETASSSSSGNKGVSQNATVESTAEVDETASQKAASATVTSAIEAAEKVTTAPAASTSAQTTPTSATPVTTEPAGTDESKPKTTAPATHPTTEYVETAFVFTDENGNSIENVEVFIQLNADEGESFGTESVIAVGVTDDDGRAPWVIDGDEFTEGDYLVTAVLGNEKRYYHVSISQDDIGGEFNLTWQ